MSLRTLRVAVALRGMATTGRGAADAVFPPPGVERLRDTGDGVPVGGVILRRTPGERVGAIVVGERVKSLVEVPIVQRRALPQDQVVEAAQPPCYVSF